MRRSTRAAWWMVPMLGVTATLWAEPAPTPTAPESTSEAPAKAQPWIRMSDNGDVLKMQVAVREFKRDGDDEHTLTIAGAVHIGERSFYKQLQDTLDALDLVLFEGVMPPGAGVGVPDDQLTDAEKVDRTRLRVRLLGVLMERERKANKAYPESVDALAESLKDQRQELGWVNVIRNDAWGRPILFAKTSNTTTTTIDGQTKTTTTDGIDLVSRGADGKEGGTGAAADISFAELIAKKPLQPAELGKDHGLQQRLARAFRLHFQLDEMDHDKPNWRNSDLSIDEIEKRLNAEGADDSTLFSLLDGSSFMGQMAGMILGMVERMPGAPARGRLMIMEMLTHTDDELLGAGLPGGERMMQVILNERNDVVVENVAKVLESKNPPKRLGIIYGAGHMPDLIAKLQERFGYKQVGETWVTAMSLDLAKEGIARSEVVMNRAMIKRQIDMMKKTRR